MSNEVDSTTRAIEVKSRENAKKVKTYHTADWGDYNMSFMVYGSGSAVGTCQKSQYTLHTVALIATAL